MLNNNVFSFDEDFSTPIEKLFNIYKIIFQYGNYQIYITNLAYTIDNLIQNIKENYEYETVEYIESLDSFNINESNSCIRLV